MDTLDTSQQANEIPVLRLNDHSIVYLNEIRKWAKFLSILGFIGVGIIVLLALSIGSIMNLISALSPTPLPVSPFFLTVFYLLIALLYFFPVLFLYRFSTKMKIALEERNETELTDSFSNLKSMFKFMGVMAIVILSIYLLILIGIIFAAIFVRH
jgi:hypothetical protein